MYTMDLHRQLPVTYLGNFHPMKWKQNTSTTRSSSVWLFLVYLASFFVLPVVGVVGHGGQELQQAVQSIAVACWEQVDQKLGDTLLLLRLQRCGTDQQGARERQKMGPSGEKRAEAARCSHVVLMNAV